MATDTARSIPQHTPGENPDGFAESKTMSFGDHLDELRTCMIRALIGTALATFVALFFGQDILNIVCRPLFEVQQANGLAPSLQILSPSAGFIEYLKIGFLSGLLVSTPWVFYQAWRFVASGLYEKEQRFVRMLLPSSAVLFVGGVLFLYFVVLPIVLAFFIRFNQSFGTFVPQAIVAKADQLSPTSDASTRPIGMHGLNVDLLVQDPKSPAPGTVWYNTTTHRLMVQTDEEVWSTSLERGAASRTMQSQFAIDFYVSFVLLLALAFGIAFETPIVVVFLSWSGIVPAATMMRGRRYILLGSVVLAAVLTPPDVVSQLLLAAPMYLLFEVGILAARVLERGRAVEA